MATITRAPQDNGQIMIMASIGHVCLQWARLEMFVLGAIAAIERIPVEKSEVLFGGMDLIPRLNMAVNLARHAKLPQPLVSRMDKIRKKVQSDLADRRNQAVHGAHRDWEGYEVTLTMVRWKGDRRSQRLTVNDIHNLAMEIHAVAEETYAAMEAVYAWRINRIAEQNSLVDMTGQLRE